MNLMKPCLSYIHHPIHAFSLNLPRLLPIDPQLEPSPLLPHRRRDIQQDSAGYIVARHLIPSASSSNSAADNNNSSGDHALSVTQGAGARGVIDGDDATSRAPSHLRGAPRTSTRKTTRTPCPLPHMNPGLGGPYRDDPNARRARRAAGGLGRRGDRDDADGARQPGPGDAIRWGREDSPAPIMYADARTASPRPQAAYAAERASPGPGAAYNARRASPGPQAVYGGGDYSYTIFDRPRIVSSRLSSVLTFLLPALTLISYSSSSS
ncbi:hypothetical protein B0H14DRAFT_3863625 [Mycena olivaceomarginata]|nr:hypothetical protein B0H14DRAFT_3863625 [Mycena olivaceomarginata]